MPQMTRRRITLFDMMVLVAATAVGISLGRPLLVISFEQTYSVISVSGAITYSMPMIGSIADVILSAFLVSSPGVMAWTLALVLLALRQPNPGRRRLAREPGVVASWAAATSMASVMACWISFSHFEPSIRAEASLCLLFMGAGLAIGLTWFLASRPVLSPRLVGYGIVASTLAVVTAGWDLFLIHSLHPWLGERFAQTYAPLWLHGGGVSIGMGVAVAWVVLLMGRTWRPDSNWIDRLGRLLGLYWVASTPVYFWALAAARF